jgi:molybdenum cofactor biosynthesis enzyme MoaA
MTTTNTPYLTIAITNKCNFNCYYCSPDGNDGMGEAYGTETNKISNKDLEEKIVIAEEEGIKKIRFTGGEPLLFKGITELLTFVEKNTKLEYALATNGSNIDRFIDEFEKLKRLDIRISLDTLNRDHFAKICGCSEKQYDKVIENIKLLSSKNMLNRVAAVVTQDNLDQIKPLIKFCEELHINLKLFDMYATPETKKQWSQSYTLLNDIKKEVEQVSTSVRQINYTQAFGIPSLEYKTKNNSTIRIKDSTSGTRYHQDLCATCISLPCQEGLYTILYSSNQKLIPCRLSPSHFEANTPQKFRENLKYLIEVFQKSYHENKFWKNEKQNI